MHHLLETKSQTEKKYVSIVNDMDDKQTSVLRIVKMEWGSTYQLTSLETFPQHLT